MRCTHLLLVAPLTTVTIDAALSSGWNGVARRVVVDAAARSGSEDHRCGSRSYIRRRQRSWNHGVLGFGTTTVEQPTISTEAESDNQSAKVDAAGALDGNMLSPNSSTQTSDAWSIGRVIGSIKTGSTNVWTNYKECRAIRRRVKEGHKLMYSEFTCLQREKKDRAKLLNLAFTLFFVPEYLPFICFSSVIPSMLDAPDAVAKNYQRCSVSRIKATLSGIAQLEDDLLKKRRRKEIEKVEAYLAMAREILGAKSKRDVFVRLHGHIVGPEPQTRKEERVAMRGVASDLPPPAVKGLAQGIGAGFPFAPVFYLRLKVRGHVRELGEADAVLRQYPLSTLSDAEVQEACNARGIDAIGSNQGKLRNSLDEWLRLTSGPSRELAPGTVFLPDRARLLGLGLNYVDTLRTGKNAELSRKACCSPPF